MSQKSLIIVESPTKIKTLKQILGTNYQFESSYGHIRDLPESEFGIDLENDFEPTYVPMKDKAEVIRKLKEAAKECDTIYLCPDPDREGEAIAWHISELIGAGKKMQRVTFQSITKDAVSQALTIPRSIDLALVNAQQARRLLDRIVGYSISPLLNRRLRRGRSEAVSAGRVQSVALKLVVDREKEILAFIPREYWNIESRLTPDAQNVSKNQFSAFLHSIDSKRVEKEVPQGKESSICTISSQKEADAIFNDLQKQLFTLSSIDRKDRKRQPEAPFTTSTLQQEASRHFRFSPSKTMEIAQNLYEGREIGGQGTIGLITYMRTDSVRVAPEALSELRSYIQNVHGTEFLYSSIRNFQMKKSAQDAHEAIRPADVMLTPDSVREYLTYDQLSLYTLIWKRYVASQMANAIYDTLTYDIEAGPRYLFRATGSRLKFSGFLSVYEEKQDEDEADKETSAEKKESFILLPEVKEGDVLQVNELKKIQSFTRPPARFTEATLIKELEKSGIGRPSTYASIMKKILARDYTEKEQGRLKPTDLGSIVTEMLESHFQSIMNIGFTASMENSLEEIAENKLNWKEVLKDFWAPFSASLNEAQETLIPPKITTDIPCPKCEASLQKIWFKSKYFLGCSRYPECDFSGSLEEQQFDKTVYDENFDWDQPCPKCQSGMKIRFGKFGPFLGCISYPECRGIVNIPKKGEALDAAEHHACPASGCDGLLTQKRSRFGKLFWSCSSFPECDAIGDSIEAIQEKFGDRKKTAYVKPESSKGRSSAKKTATKKKEGETASKKTVKREPKKAVTEKKEKIASKKAVKKSVDKNEVSDPKVVPKKRAVKKAPSTKKEKVTSEG